MGSVPLAIYFLCKKVQGAEFYCPEWKPVPHLELLTLPLVQQQLQIFYK